MRKGRDKMEKQRRSNFELLRIISMIFIVAGHLVCHGVQKVLSGEAYVTWSTGTTANRIISCIFSPGGVLV